MHFSLLQLGFAVQSSVTRHRVEKQVLPDPAKAQEMPEVAEGHVEGTVDLLPYIWVPDTCLALSCWQTHSVSPHNV